MTQEQERLRDANKIIDEVKLMRDMQKTFFKLKDKEDLQAAKNQEKKVDLLIKDYFTDKTQTKLF